MDERNYHFDFDFTPTGQDKLSKKPVKPEE